MIYVLWHEWCLIFAQLYLQIEQKLQKEEKKERAVDYAVVKSYSGSWLPITQGLCVCLCFPWSDEPRIKLQPGENISVTRWRKWVCLLPLKYWLFHCGAVFKVWMATWSNWHRERLVWIESYPFLNFHPIEELVIQHSFAHNQPLLNVNRDDVPKQTGTETLFGWNLVDWHRRSK